MANLKRSANPLRCLGDFGQSLWLDYIRRDLLDTGELQRMIDEDGLRGVTVNPTILEHAFKESNAYDPEIRRLVVEGKQAADIYEALAISDVQRAADLFRPLYERSQGRHGFVSLEVSPYLAHDTERTIAEARRFWRELDRPNVMIKVPATLEGLLAIQRLIAEGININVTLLFGLPRYRRVAEAYLRGLEDRLTLGNPIDRVASVASFFLSRIDVLIDPLLEKQARLGGAPAQAAGQLKGQVAIASAKLAYQNFESIFSKDRFFQLARQGAWSQRLLWASTSTKNPAYSDVKYVEALIGPDTVNTVPPETLEAYRNHGRPAVRLPHGMAEARAVFDQLPGFNIDIDSVTQQLEDEGVQKFATSYDKVLLALEEKCNKILREQHIAVQAGG
jgi:transaldolase